MSVFSDSSFLLSYLSAFSNGFQKNFFLYHDLSERIKVIAENKITKFSDEQNFDLNKALEISKNRFFPVAGVKKSLSLLSCEQMQAIFPTFSLEDDPLHSIKSFLENSDTAKLLSLAYYNSDDEVKCAIEAEYNIREKALRGVFANEGQKIFKQLHGALKKNMHRYIQMAISLTGIFDLFSHGENGIIGAYEASFRLKMLFKLLAFPSLLSQFFLGYFERRVAMTLTASTIATITLFTFSYFKYFTPCPDKAWGLTNLRAEILNADEPYFRRPKLKQQILNAFESGKGVLVIGNSGAGKTMSILYVIKGILVDRTDKTEIQEAFMGTASEMCKDRFSEIQKEFDGYQRNVLFFFDEFGGFFDKGKNEAVVANSLKKFLDKFKFVIGSTTKMEFEQFIEKNEIINQTMNERRFVVIDLEEVQKVNLKDILLEYIDYKSPQTCLTEEDIDYIIEKSNEFSPKSAPVDRCVTLLKTALAKFHAHSLKSLIDELSDLNAQKETLSNQKQHAGANYKAEKNKEINELSEQIIQKEAKLNAQENRIKALKKLEETYATIKRKSYQLSQDKAVVNSRAYVEWLKNKALEKALSVIIQKERESFGLFPCLNKNLIDSILEEKDRGKLENQEGEVFQEKMEQDSEQEPGWDLM